MRKIGYSAGMKAVVMLMQEIFTVVLVICTILVSTLFERSMINVGDVRNTAFVDSGYYEGLFRDAVGEVLTYIGYKEQFETDGIYNPEKAVNVMMYRNNGLEQTNVRKLPGSEEQFRYYLVDLEDWSRDYVKQICRVESRLYETQEGVMHQIQEVYVNDEIVLESDIIIQRLQEMDPSLQRYIVTKAQYYYGGYYDLSAYGLEELTTVEDMTFSEVQGGKNEDTAEVGLGQDQTSAEVGLGQDQTSAEAGLGQDQSSEEAGLGQDQASTAAEVADVASLGKESAKEGAPEEQALNAPRSEIEEEQMLEHSIQMIIDGKLFELEDQALRQILNELGLMEASSRVDIPVLEEKYMTVDGSTIMEAFLRGSITLQEMSDIYQSLAYTLNTIGGEITAYKRLVNKFEKNKSNLQFWVYEESTNRYFTNLDIHLEEPGSKEFFPEKGEALGSYFYYNKNDIRLATNVKGMEDTFYNSLENSNGGRSSVIFVGMDTTFPYEDDYAQAKEEYGQLQPWAAVALAAAIICVFGCFLSFIYLSLAAGRSREDDEIHLNGFDRMKTEILMTGFVGIFIGTIFVIERMLSLKPVHDLVGYMIMAGCMTFLLVGLFMAFYLSFVRRIKKSVLWSGSLLYWIGRGIGKAVRNWKPSVKILALFTGHVILTLLLAVTALTWAYKRQVVLLILVLYLFLCAAEVIAFLREGVQRNMMISGIKRIAGGDLEYEIDTQILKGDNRAMGDAINKIGEGLYHAVDASMKNERLKADLITNVSHDIKTPLTSIINYVDLLKREKLENEKARNYIAVLDAKSQRLKQLTEDLVEASKVSSGNITLQMERLNFVELVYQTAGEFNERFEARGLTAVTKLPKEPVIILADGRRIWRVIENLYNNVAKYAMEHTRVYVGMEVLENTAFFSIKNISEQALNIDASELTERFIRGDVSRSTEGSGLGLSIAKNLTNLMGGTFDIYLDGDLFKVTVSFPIAPKTLEIEEKPG